MKIKQKSSRWAHLQNKTRSVWKRYQDQTHTDSSEGDKDRAQQACEKGKDQDGNRAMWRPCIMLGSKVRHILLLMAFSCQWLCKYSTSIIINSCVCSSQCLRTSNCRLHVFKNGNVYHLFLSSSQQWHSCFSSILPQNMLLSKNLWRNSSLSKQQHPAGTRVLLLSFTLSNHNMTVYLGFCQMLFRWPNESAHRRKGACRVAVLSVPHSICPWL